MSEQKTVRVRIAVAMDAEGRWAASGWGDREGLETGTHARDARDMLPGCADDDIPIRWVEADIPLPQPQTVEGEVVR